MVFFWKTRIFLRIMIFFLSTFFNQNWVGAFLVWLVFFLNSKYFFTLLYQNFECFSELCPKKGRNQVPRFLLFSDYACCINETWQAGETGTREKFHSPPLCPSPSRRGSTRPWFRGQVIHKKNEKLPQHQNIHFCKAEFKVFPSH